MRTINVTITEEEFKQLLSKHIIISNKDRFVNLLSGILCKDAYSMSTIYKAMLDIYTVLKYKKGEFVYVKYDYLATWRINKDATLKLPGVIDNNIPCEITSINEYNELSYNIKYLAVKEGETTPVEQEYMISDNAIVGKVENVEQVLDDLEKCC